MSQVLLTDRISRRGRRNARVKRRPTQNERLAQEFWSRRGEWISLVEILNIRPRISQFSARIWELRHRWGLDIENRKVWVDGECHSWFRLVEPQSSSAPASAAKPAEKPGELFPGYSPEMRHRDDG